MPIIKSFESLKNRTDLRMVFDCDDVLLNLLHPLHLYFNRTYQSNLRLEDYTDYNLCNVWKCSEKECWSILDNYYELDEFSRLSPRADAVESVKRLVAISSYNSVLTSRPLCLDHKTITNVNLHFNDTFQYIKFASNSGKNGMRQKKFEFCLDNNIELLFEDCPEYALDAARNGILVYMLKMPFNKDVIHPNIRRVEWPDVDKDIFY